MFRNTILLAGNSARLLLRNKAYIFIVFLVPFLSTLFLNLWNDTPADPVAESQIYRLESDDVTLAYVVDYYRYPVKVYDKVCDSSSEDTLSSLSGAGLFQIFHLDARKMSDAEIKESVERTIENDKVGAVLVLGSDTASSRLYKTDDDKRFDALKEALKVSEIKPDVTTEVRLLNAGGDDIDWLATRSFGYCLAFCTIAFIFGGVLILGTILEEKNDNVFERIMLSKTRLVDYLLSKGLLVLITTMIQSLVMTLTYRFVIDSKINLSTFQFFTIIALLGLIFNLLSVCIGIYFNSMAAAAFMAFTVWSSTALLSGLYFDINGASDIYKKVALLLPQRWAMFSVDRFINGDSSGYQLILYVTAAYLIVIIITGVLGLKIAKKE